MVRVTRPRVLHSGLRGVLALAVLFVLVVAASPLAQAATITLVNQDGPGEGFNDPTPRAPVGGNTGTTLGAQRLIAMQRAADIWGALLNSSVTILVGVQFNSLFCGPTSAVLGSAGPTYVARDFAGALVPGTWYAGALADALFGAELVPGMDDITAQFNSALDTGCFPRTWYYGLDASPPGTDIDFVTVGLHELAHGLGFLTVVDLGTGAKLGGFDDSYMRHLEHHGAAVANYPNMTNQQRVAASTATGDLHWIGPAVRGASGGLTAGTVGDHVRMFAPNPQQGGSSVSHWDTALSPNQLMEPSYTVPIHNPDMELPLFVDVGWTVVGAGPDIDVMPASKDYGSLFAGFTSDQTFTVRNTGLAPLNVSATSVTGPFSIVNGVGAFVLAPGATQQVIVRFTSAPPGGAKAGILQFTSDDPDTPTKDVALSGMTLLPVVTLTTIDATATETNQTTGAFKVSRTGPTTNPLVVNYTIGGTAGNGVDYAALPGTVTIPAGADFAPIVVTPVDDTVTGEGNETVILTLAASAAYSVGTPSSGTVTIVDNDRSLQFTMATYQTLEGTKLVPIAVTRLGPLTVQVSVRCRTVLGGTAVPGPGQDYTPIDRLLVFAVGVRTVNCLVPILNDLVADGPKTIHLELHTAAGPGANLGSPFTAVLEIADNRAGIVQFAVATAVVGEGLQTFLKVIRTGVNLVGGVTVDYAAIGGTATDTVDYNLLGTGTLTFNPGVASMQIPLSTIQDVELEGNETVIVRLSNVTGGASPGTRRDMTVTIVDDEQALQFTAATYQVMEGAANAVIGVTRVGPVTTRVTVRCRTVPGGTATAVPDQDYRDVARTIVFAVGVRTQNCLVPILDDTLVDGPRTVNLQLDTPVGPGATLGSHINAVLTIADNDRPGTFRFDAMTFTVTEGGTGLLRVRRSGTNLGSGVTVDYVVTGGSATGGGIDYTLANGTLTFAAKQTSATIQVPTAVDALFDGNETVVVMLQNPSSGATIAQPDTTTLTIREGTRAQVRFLNGLCINPGCQSFTAQLRAEEGNTFFSMSGVTSAYQNVKRATLSNFVLTALEFPEIPPIRFFGSFAITPNRRYRLILTISGGNLVLLQTDEGAIPMTSGPLELDRLPVQSIPADTTPQFRFGPLPRRLLTH